MEKLDLTKTYKSYYTANKKPEVIDIEAAKYISITGKGDPSGKEFGDKIQALYSTAYTLKFHYKEQNKDFAVAKLEGLWWFNTDLYGHYSMEEAPLKIERSEWEYRLLIRIPEFVNESDVENAVSIAFEKKGLPYISGVKFFEMNEGKCVQMMHIGPFSEEPKTLAMMNQMMKKNAFQQNGLHHEIYLSDFRKTPSDKIKTILREPVK